MKTLDEIRYAARKSGRPLDILQALGRLFPALRNQWWVADGYVMTIYDIPKVLKEAQRCHQMCGHAAAFCLGVYNSGRNKFDFINAMGEMNMDDREVVVSWGADTFYL